MEGTEGAYLVLGFVELLSDWRFVAAVVVYLTFVCYMDRQGKETF